MILRQTLQNPVNGNWNGGPKQVFDWSIKGHRGADSKGTFVRIGSYSANHWFNVAQGRTDKLTLSHAKSHLRGTQAGFDSKFEYIED